MARTYKPESMMFERWAMLGLPGLPFGETQAQPAKAESQSYTDHMAQAPDASAGRGIISEHDTAIGELEKSVGLQPTVGRGGGGSAWRGFSTVKPSEWQRRIAVIKKINPEAATRLKALIADGRSMVEPWQKLLQQEGAARTRPPSEPGGPAVEKPPPPADEPRCPGCHRMMRYCICDGTGREPGDPPPPAAPATKDPQTQDPIEKGLLQ